MNEDLLVRIKKVFFDKIKSGEKKFEYRSNSPYWRSRLVGRKYKTISFHYQTGERLTMKFLGVRLVKKPKSLIDSPYLTTDKVFRISLG